MADSITGVGSEEIFLLTPNFKFRGVSEGLLRRSLINYPGSSFQIFPEVNETPIIYEAQFLVSNKEEEYYLIDFFNSHKGMHSRFWAEVHRNEIKLSEQVPAGSTNVFTKRNDAYRLYCGYERVCFKMRNGDKVIRHITEVADDVNNNRYNMSIDAGLDRNMGPELVDYTSRLILCRFDSDDLKFTFNTDSISTVNLRFRELVKEYDYI